MHYLHLKIGYLHFKKHYLHFLKPYFRGEIRYADRQKRASEMLPKVKYVKSLPAFRFLSAN